MKFKVGPNKRVTSGFGKEGRRAEEYKKIVGHYHTGVDYNNGYGSPVISDNFGSVYKVITPDMNKAGWCGVYYLCPDDKEGWVEVCQGHCSKVYVKPGDLISEGQEIGLEGNKGEVYSGGVRITKEMQDNGDKRGSHVHEQFRPVRKVKRTTSGKHYLNSANGKRYQDELGYYYEIKYDNETNGCVNPNLYLVEKSSLPASIVKALIKLLLGKK